MAGQTDGCGAPAGGAPIKDAGNQAIIQGRVTRDGAPPAGAPQPSVWPAIRTRLRA